MAKTLENYSNHENNTKTFFQIECKKWTATKIKLKKENNTEMFQMKEII